MKSLSTDQEIPTKETLLVVDDEAGPRESLRMILKPLYEVHTASGGQKEGRIHQDLINDRHTPGKNLAPEEKKAGTKPSRPGGLWARPG